jgi:hypothetical protein
MRSSGLCSRPATSRMVPRPRFLLSAEFTRGCRSSEFHAGSMPGGKSCERIFSTDPVMTPWRNDVILRRLDGVHDARHQYGPRGGSEAGAGPRAGSSGPGTLAWQVLRGSAMADYPAGGDGGRRPPDWGRGGGPWRGGFKKGPQPRGVGEPYRARPSRGGAKNQGPIRLARVAGNDFELVHPPEVKEVALDYEEGLELWKAGDPEGARDALRYALEACHDNLWVHVALGRLALAEYRDRRLAQTHFMRAVDLGRRALPKGFNGRLPRDRPDNQPFFDALEGLAECMAAAGMKNESEQLRAMSARLASGPK